MRLTADLQEPSDGLVKVWRSARSRSIFTSFFPHLEKIDEMEISKFQPFYFDGIPSPRRFSYVTMEIDVHRPTFNDQSSQLLPRQNPHNGPFLASLRIHWTRSTKRHVSFTFQVLVLSSRVWRLSKKKAKNKQQFHFNKKTILFTIKG
jgi:hypothetical protein